MTIKQQWYKFWGRHEDGSRHIWQPMSSWTKHNCAALAEGYPHHEVYKCSKCKIIGSECYLVEKI